MKTLTLALLVFISVLVSGCAGMNRGSSECLRKVCMGHGDSIVTTNPDRYTCISEYTMLFCDRVGVRSYCQCRRIR